MKILLKLVNCAAALTAAAMALGAVIGLMPLAIVCPAHGEALVRLQATGACVLVIALVSLMILGLIAASLDRATQ